MLVAALGKKGSGKSASLRKLTSLALRAKAPIFYHDPNGQIADAAGRVYGSIAAYVADTHPTFLSIFRGVSSEDVAALALAVQDVTVVLDELDAAFTNKRYISTKDSAIRRIIHEGRHHRVSLMGTFRRTPNVHEDFVSQMDYAFVFFQSGSSKSDIRALNERLGASYAARAPTLKTGEFVVWHDAGADDVALQRLTIHQIMARIVADLPKRRANRAAASQKPPKHAPPGPKPQKSKLEDWFFM